MNLERAEKAATHITDLMADVRTLAANGSAQLFADPYYRQFFDKYIAGVSATMGKTGTNLAAKAVLCAGYELWDHVHEGMEDYEDELKKGKEGKRE